MTNEDDKVSPSSGESGDVCTTFQGALPEVLQNQQVERSVQQYHNDAILTGNTTGDSDNVDDILGTTAEQLDGPEAAEGNTPVSALSGASADNNSAWASIPANSLNLSEESPSVLMKPSESESIASETLPGNTTGGFLANMSDTTSTDESEQLGGGRLWEMANREAERTKDAPMSEESQRFSRSIMGAAVKGSRSVGKRNFHTA
jgi:hypothetical protein